VIGWGVWGVSKLFLGVFLTFWSVLVGLGFWGRDAKNDGKSHGCEYRFGNKCSAFLPEHFCGAFAGAFAGAFECAFLPTTNLANFIRIIFFLCCDLTKLLKW